MTTSALEQTPAGWLAQDLRDDTSWISRLSAEDAADLITMVSAAHRPRDRFHAAPALAARD